MATISGYSSTDLRGKNISQFCQPNFPGPFERTVPLLNKKRVVFETGIIHQTGVIVPALVRLHIFSSPETGKLLIEGFVEDISEEKTKSRKLELLNRQMSGSLEEKTRFISYLGHELKGPVSSLLGLLHLFDRNNLTSKQLEQLEGLLVSSQNLRDFLNDLFQLAELGHEEGRLENGPINIVQLFSNLKITFSLIAGNSGMALEFEKEDQAPNVISADKAKVLRVFYNLISNAIKYSEGTSIKIKVGLSKKEGDAVTLKCSVTDDGNGISPEEQRKVFDIYYQGKKNTGEEGSSGLGLWLSSELVRMLGGKIGVVSTPGSGASFWFTFQASVAHIADDIVTNSEALFNAFKGLQGKIAIVADDNKFHREVTSAILKKAKMDVLMATSGEEVVGLLKSHHPSIIVLDVQMPGRGGVWAVGKIRNTDKYRQIKILGLTGYSRNAIAKELVNKGFDEIISKPAGPEILLNTINKLIKGTSVRKVDKISSNKNREVINFEVINKLEEYGGKQMVKEAFEEFENDFAIKYKQITYSAKISDFKEILYKLHAIKANSATLGLTRVVRASESLENDIEKNDLSSIVKDIKELQERFIEYKVHKNECYN